MVVGSVGGYEEVEHRILTPLIRSIVRNVAGSKIHVPSPKDGDEDRRLRGAPDARIDLIDNREAIEDRIDAA